MSAKVLGAVLAGGESSRFGSDKALALLEGKPLIDHVVAALAPQVDAVVICGRRDPAHTSLADRPGPGLGPLGGLNAALHHARTEGFAFVLTAGCDMPGFCPNVRATLMGHAPAVLIGQRLAGLWPAELAPALDDFLAASSDRSIRAWMRLCGAQERPFAERMPNVNTPGDLERLTAGAEVRP